MTKNFIRKTRPKTEKELKTAIKDIDRQISYQKSIGDTSNLESLMTTLELCEYRLRRLQVLKKRRATI